MKEFVLNATPLIYLSKIGLLKKLVAHSSIVFFTTDVVASEVLDNDFPENVFIKQMIGENKLRVENISIQKQFKLEELGAGEASALSLAVEKKVALITDDRVAIAIGKVHKIIVFHSTFLLFLAIEKKIITKPEALSYLDAMVDSGWYCDIQTYVNIKRAIEGY